MSFGPLLKRFDIIALAVALLLPLLDLVLPPAFQLGGDMREVLIFAILALGLNIVTGFSGLLHLGVAGFMAIGAYTYAILTCEIYPYQLNFWEGTIAAVVVGAVAGILLGAPTLRLRGDYLAIVTMGFGEIIQDVLRNVYTVTKGTQGINPLPPPMMFGETFGADYRPWYYLFLAILVVVVVLNRNLERSRLGRAWMSLREDELASSCMGINPVKTKLLAFAAGAALCSLSGALYACIRGLAEPGNYDFSISVLALSIAIVGGMGNINGVLLGALIMVGLNSIAIQKLAAYLKNQGLSSADNIFSDPTNWKFMIYGLALVLMMRFKPEGFLPSRKVKAELHPDEPVTPKGAVGENT